MNTTNPRPAARQQRGVSFVELLISTAVATVALGGVLPGMKSAMERRHLDGATAQLQTDIQFARSLAVAQNRTLRVSFRSDASGACYVVHTGSAGDCTCVGSDVPVCTAGAWAARAVRFEATGPVQISSNVASMVLEPSKGTVSPTGTIRLQASGDLAVNLVVNLMGRVRTCTPATRLSGYVSC